MKMERPQGRHINTKSKLTDYVVKDLDEVKKIIFKKELSSEASELSSFLNNPSKNNL